VLSQSHFSTFPLLLDSYGEGDKFRTERCIDF
jgi:hypothetical protein